MLFRYLIRHKDKYPSFPAKQTGANNKVALGGEAFFPNGALKDNHLGFVMRAKQCLRPKRPLTRNTASSLMLTNCLPLRMPACVNKRR